MTVPRSTRVSVDISLVDTTTGWAAAEAGQGKAFLTTLILITVDAETGPAVNTLMCLFPAAFDAATALTTMPLASRVAMGCSSTVARFQLSLNWRRTKPPSAVVMPDVATIEKIHPVAAASLRPTMFGYTVGVTTALKEISLAFAPSSVTWVVGSCVESVTTRYRYAPGFVGAGRVALATVIVSAPAVRLPPVTPA